MVSALERCGIDCRWNEGQGEGGWCVAERGKQLAVEAQQPKGGAVSFPFFPFSFLPFSSQFTLPHFSSRFPFAFHALLPIATPHPYLFYTRKPFPSILLFLLGFLINRLPSSSLLALSHLSSFLGHFTSPFSSHPSGSPLRSPNSPRNLPTSGAPVTFQIV